MRLWVAVIVSLTMLLGCTNTNEVDRGLAVRKLFMQKNGVRFIAEITADYGDMTHSFTMRCTAGSTGDVSFEVMEPDTISGIEGTISASGGRLKFEDRILLFEPLVFGQLSPVLAPWLMVKAIQGGYIRAQSNDRDGCQLMIEDTYQGASLQTELTLSKENVPVYCEIIWSNRRILTVHITSFDKV